MSHRNEFVTEFLTNPGSVPIPPGKEEAGALRLHTFGLVNVKTYGAKGNGIEDDSLSVLAARDAAASTGATLFFPHGTYIMSRPIPLWDGFTIVGAGRKKTLISNAVTDVFNWTGDIAHGSIERLWIAASGGHIVYQGDANVAMSVIRDVTLDQMNPAKSVWHGDANTVQETGLYIDMLIENVDMSMAANATVPGWRILRGQGGANSNTFRRLRVNANWSHVPFFEIENTGVANHAYDNTFEDITGEGCEGGIVDAKSVQGLRIFNVYDYDSVTFAKSIFKVGSSVSGPPSRGIQIARSGRRNGALGAGAYDVELAADIQLATIDSVAPPFGDAVLSASIYTVITNVPGYESWIRGLSPDSATAVGVVLDAISALNASGSKIASFRNGGLERASVNRSGGICPGTPAGVAQTGAVYQGAGAPAAGNGANGDFFLRTDTPGVANQRIYVKSAGAWVGIV